MFQIFKSKTAVPGDFSFLGTDLHSHLIPGIDDGAKTVEESLELLQTLHRLGYRKVFTTPHVINDLYPNTPEDILQKLDMVNREIQLAGIDIQLGAAAEYFIDEHFASLIAHNSLLLLPGRRVLVEMSAIQAPPNLFNDLFRLQTKGFQPVLAHPERYLFLKDDFRQYTRLKDYGCEFQLNALSVTGYYGKPVKDNALKLLKHGMINFIGTDLHHARHAELLQQMCRDKEIMGLLAKYSYSNQELI